MTQSIVERKSLIETACKKIYDDLEATVKDFSELHNPQVADDYDKIHDRLLFLSATERDLNGLLRIANQFKRQVDITFLDLRNQLEDAKMEAIQKRSFATMGASFESKEEKVAKLRSLTIEESHDLEQWEVLRVEVNYLIDLIGSHQREANRERRDIDTRIKLLSLY